MILQPPESTHFPYTTLFRSKGRSRQRGEQREVAADEPARRAPRCHRARIGGDAAGVVLLHDGAPERVAREVARSEEHTSELQSRRDLVCRLLLEKKNEK